MHQNAFYETAVTGSSCVPISIKFAVGFPISVLSHTENLIPSVSDVLLEQFVHPDDYPSLVETLNSLINDNEGTLTTHSRFPVGTEYHWFYITASPVKVDEKITSIDGLMFDVSEYLQHGGEDLVIREYNRRSIIRNNAVSYNEISLTEILEIDYLTKIQQPFSKIKGLYSCILDNKGDIIATAKKHDRRIKPDKFDFQMQKVIRIEQQDAAFWVLAADKKAIIDEYFSLAEILAQTVSRLANAFVMTLKEIDNSRSTSRVLGQNIEEQIMLHNIYSVILDSDKTEESITKLMDFSGKFLRLEKISVFMNKTDYLLKNTYFWAKNAQPSQTSIINYNDIKELNDVLNTEEMYFTKEESIKLPFEHSNAYCASQLLEGGDSTGIILFEAEQNRQWFNRERKFIKTISQILSTIIMRANVEKKLYSSRQALKVLAFTDPELKIPNRAKYEQRLAQAISNKASGTVLFFEIANLRKTAEYYGMGYAELLMKSVSTYLHAISEEYITIYRYGENIISMIILNDDYEATLLLAQRISRKFSKPWQMNANRHTLRTATGIALFPQNGEKVEELTRAALLAMNRAKENPEKTYEFFGETVKNEILASKLLEQRLRNAVQNNFEDFKIVYQPVISVSTGEIVSCEAFIRWQDDENKSILPSFFMELAEYLGISHKIDAWVLDTVASFCSQIIESTGLPFKISVNLTTHELQSTEIVQTLQDVLGKYNLSVENIIVEIPEIAYTRASSHINAALAGLSQLGIGITADGFGGESLALDIFNNVFINCIKIDKNIFIEEDDEFIKILANSIVLLAKSKGIQLCVKGIETLAQKEKVQQLGNDLIQGYLVSKPLSPDDFMVFLENYHKSISIK